MGCDGAGGTEVRSCVGLSDVKVQAMGMEAEGGGEPFLWKDFQGGRVSLSSLSSHSLPSVASFSEYKARYFKEP